MSLRIGRQGPDCRNATPVLAAGPRHLRDARSAVPLLLARPDEPIPGLANSGNVTNDRDGRLRQRQSATLQEIAGDRHPQGQLAGGLLGGNLRRGGGVAIRGVPQKEDAEQGQAKFGCRQSAAFLNRCWTPRVFGYVIVSRLGGSVPPIVGKITLSSRELPTRSARVRFLY